MSNTQRVSFAVDADSVSLTSLCKKDFLELQMRAISSVRPNLNNSWFTREAMEDAIDSFKNKPILGYFNMEGDFEGHNGTWRRDPETGLDYWDTQDGEQILGFIREGDDVKVVDDADGNAWLCLSCALWTQYNFKQVKRLIKDAKRAKETGGVTKNISVEVDILEGEREADGVYRIDKFALAGITILGSRKGKQVLPGIAGAALSLTDISGSDFYARQQTAFRAAYARLENSVDGNGEEDVLMNEQTNTNDGQITEPAAASFEGQAQVQDTDPVPTDPVATDPNASDITATDPTPEEGHADFTECHAGEGGEPAAAENEHCAEGGDAGEGNDQNGGDEDDDEDDEDEGEKGEGKKEHESQDADAVPDNDKVVREVRDVAWLLNGFAFPFDRIAETLCYYEYLKEERPEEAPHADYIVAVLKRVNNALIKIQGGLGGLLSKVSEGITEADEAYEAKLEQYEDIDAVIGKYEAMEASNKELSDQVADLNDRLLKYSHADFMQQVETLLKSAKLDEAVSKEIFEACQNGSLRTYDEAKVKVALAVFEAQSQIDNIPQADNGLQCPVEQPSLRETYDSTAEENPRDTWGRLRKHFGKK